MDQDRTGAQNAGTTSEDTSRAEEHVRNAEENRDALEAQKRRTDATTSTETDRPIQGSTPASGGGDTGYSRTGTDGGMRATGSSGASEDALGAQARVQDAERNRDALEAQSERVERTTSSETDRPIGQQ